MNPGESNTLTYSTIPGTDLLNTAVAYAPEMESVFDSAEVLVILPFTPKPDYTIEKTVDFNDNGIYHNREYGDVNTIATWKIVVKNTGDVYLKGITLKDTNMKITPLVFDLNIGETKTFYYDTTITKDTVNTATIEHELLPKKSSTAEALIDEILPYTEPEPFLPFTGGNVWLIWLTAGIFIILGIGLKIKGLRI